MFGRHLHDKVLLILFVIGVIPLVVLGILALYNLNLFHRADVASIENNLINQKAEEVSGFVRGISDSFQIRVGYDQTIEPDYASQIFLLGQLLEEFPALEEVSFINLSGQETSRSDRRHPEGVSPDELQDQSRIDKFTQARGGNLYIGPVYYTLKGPVITLSSPVVNKNGAVISILTGEFNLSGLKEIMSKSRLGEEGYVYVIDRDGFLISHSQENKYSLASLKPNPFINSLIDKNQVGNFSKRYTSLWGDEVVAEGVFLDDLGFALIAEWPTREADRVVITVRNQIVVASFLVLIGTILLSLLFTNRIVGPIKILEKGTHMIAEGKLDQPITIKTGDELEELGGAFNNMMTGLKKLKDLEKEFVFIAAHDLRTPVTAMRGYLSMILDDSLGPVNPEVKDALLKISTSNQRLIQLVNDLLQVARAEAGRIPIKVSSINLSEPIRSVLVEVEPLAKEKNIKLIYQPSSDLPQALADSERLKEVMVNLVSNAIKYTLGSGDVVISHEIKDDKLITHIKDSGMGISPGNQKKLFEKYYRVESDKTRDIQGTGLGLFIVKTIIEKMNGSIWVSSEEGRGSTFSFSLPRP